MSGNTGVYLALGDSMSIDDYTGVVGGGAVKQFHKWLGPDWQLVDYTVDGCRLPHVPTDLRGDVITLTIGGNDLLTNKERYLAHGVDSFAAEHLELIDRIRCANETALFIVGDIYAPQGEMSDAEQEGLAAANAAIHENCSHIGAHCAPIRETFSGHEDDYLCLGIEPTLRGAEVIAELFRNIFQQQQQC